MSSLTILVILLNGGSLVAGFFMLWLFLHRARRDLLKRFPIRHEGETGREP